MATTKRTKKEDRPVCKTLSGHYTVAECLVHIPEDGMAPDLKYTVTLANNLVFSTGDSAGKNKGSFRSVKEFFDMHPMEADAYKAMKKDK